MQNALKKCNLKFFFHIFSSSRFSGFIGLNFFISSFCFGSFFRSFHFGRIKNRKKNGKNEEILKQIKFVDLERELYRTFFLLQTAPNEIIIALIVVVGTVTRLYHCYQSFFFVERVLVGFNNFYIKWTQLVWFYYDYNGFV